MAKITKPSTVTKKSTPATTPKSIKNVSEKTVETPTNRELTGEELVIENIATLSRLVENLGTTLELLTQKAESMAYHIIATEQILAELITENGIDLASVNARIRLKLTSDTEYLGDSGKAIDIAASIASPLPRR